MYAVTIDNSQLTWKEHEDPAPGVGEIVIEVKAAGLNPADFGQILSLYPAPAGSPPDIVGLEAAGIVMSVGPAATRFSPGDRVMALVSSGAQAQQVIVHESCAMAVPDNVSWEEAGGFPEAFITAQDALFTQAGLGMGERVCVHGGAGGVGTAGIQLAAAASASVVATVRNPSLRSAVEALGATAVDPEEFVEHGPFDVILELIGGSNLDADIRALATGGRITVIGVSGGMTPELNLPGLMFVRGSLHGSTLRRRLLEEKAQAVQAVGHHVLPLLAAGKVRVPIAATYPMSEASAAYDHFKAGGKFGKIVLTNGDGSLSLSHSPL